MGDGCNGNVAFLLQFAEDAQKGYGIRPAGHSNEHSCPIRNELVPPDRAPDADD
jgi:hypothetical protein